MPRPAARPIDSATSAHTPVLQPPNDREVEVLGRVLGAADFEGAAQLRDQIRMLQVVPGSTPTTRIYLIHPDAPRAPFSRIGRAKVPGVTRVRWLDGATLGEVSVWVQDGHLCALQYVTFTGREPMALPPADWIVQGEEAPATAAIPEVAPERAVRRAFPRALVLPVAAVLALAVAGGAFALGRSGGADLDAARAAGTAAGTAQGAADGATLGTFQGDVEGRLAGYQSTYQPTWAAARDAARSAARTARREAAASTYICPGYVDSRGVYVCTA